MKLKIFALFCLILAVLYNVHPVLADETVVIEEPPVEEVSPPQPTIRVLLKVLTTETGATLSPGTKITLDTTEEILAESAEVSIRLENGLLVVTKDGALFGTGKVFKVAPEGDDAITKIEKFSRPLSGHKSKYTIYRGAIEWRVSKDFKSIAIINHLPLEQYLWGITETSPRDPAEYVHALVVAARSYAYVRLNNKRLPYDVQATTNDQLYLGYESELRLPEVREAAELTAGQVVTYDNKPVTTPYFSRTSGSTLDWDANHKDSRPWLKAVVAVYDKGGKRVGHGYGMSLRDAKLRAVKDGWTYDQILGYYYTDTALQTVY